MFDTVVQRLKQLKLINCERPLEYVFYFSLKVPPSLPTNAEPLTNASAMTPTHQHMNPTSILVIFWLSFKLLKEFLAIGSFFKFRFADQRDNYKALCQMV